MTDQTENPNASAQDDIKTVLQDTLFQQVQTIVDFTRTDGFALQIPETDTLILPGPLARIAEFVQREIATPAASFASQSQAAQPTELTLEGIYALWKERGGDRAPAALRFARAIESEVAAHIAGMSQATKAQAEPSNRQLSEVITHAIAAKKKGLEVSQIFAVYPTDANGWLARFIMDAIEHYRPDVPNVSAPVAKEAPAVPEGWKLVPIEPTFEMLDRGHHQIDFDRTNQNTEQLNHPSQTDPDGAVTSIEQDMRDAWAAMLAAAPVASVAKEAPLYNVRPGVPTSVQVQAEEAELYRTLTGDAMNLGFGSISAALGALRKVKDSPAVPGLTVWYGPMPESNGKSNFTAILTRKDAKGLDVFGGFTIARSEYPDRVRYEADCVRYLIGELAERPDILDYDADKHSGYVAPVAVDATRDAETTEKANVMPPTRGTDSQRNALIMATINCGHVINDHSVILHRNDKKEGNALSQLADRLEAEFACRFRAQGGITNDKGSDIATTTSTVSAPIVQELAQRLESLGVTNFSFTPGPNATPETVAAEISKALDQLAAPSSPEGAQKAPEEVRNQEFGEEWSYSTDEEHYHDPEPSRLAILQHALAEVEAGDEGVSQFWIGRNVRFTGKASVGSIIEALQEQAYDACGEFAETYLEDVTPDEETELEALVTDWAKRVDRSNFWTVTDVECFTIEAAHDAIRSLRTSSTDQANADTGSAA